MRGGVREWERKGEQFFVLPTSACCMRPCECTMDQECTIKREEIPVYRSDKTKEEETRQANCMSRDRQREKESEREVEYA